MEKWIRIWPIFRRLLLLNADNTTTNAENIILTFSLCDYAIAPLTSKYVNVISNDTNINLISEFSKANATKLNQINSINKHMHAACMHMNSWKIYLTNE